MTSTALLFSGPRARLRHASALAGWFTSIEKNSSDAVNSLPGDHRGACGAS
jgi:hypothetical protein